MTEQDYIDVLDLSNVLHAKAMVRDITIANQPNIDKEEYRTVVRILLKWEESLFSAVETSCDATEDTECE